MAARGTRMRRPLPGWRPGGGGGGRTRMSALGAAMTTRTSPPKMATPIRRNRCPVSAPMVPSRSLPFLPSLPASFRPYRVRLRYRSGSKAAERPVPGSQLLIGRTLDPS
ncbi:uncharacterized protein FYW23_014476 [Sylvia borin]